MLDPYELEKGLQMDSSSRMAELLSKYGLTMEDAMEMGEDELVQKMADEFEMGNAEDLRESTEKSTRRWAAYTRVVTKGFCGGTYLFEVLPTKDHLFQVRRSISFPDFNRNSKVG